MRCLTLLLLVAFYATADAGAAGTVRPTGRKGGLAVGRMKPTVDLQQFSSTCPEGCVDGSCIADSTGGTTGYRCQKCMNALIILKLDGTCGCAAGRYSANGGPSCVDCPIGRYCLGGTYAAASPPAAIPCPANMTTRSIRGTSNRACVNLPGYRYEWSAGEVSAVRCPSDTYSTGMRKQRGCVPCPTGFSTMGKDGQTSPVACVIPPGFYLKTPGQVAPCPKGEYKSGIGPAADCTKCSAGVTTRSEASVSVDDCAVLQEGYYAVATAGPVITATKVCPQGYICPGGAPLGAFNASNPASLSASEPTIKACPARMWTQDVGSTSLDQCLTPPGFTTVNGSTSRCPDGFYRPDWAAIGQDTTCYSCGTGVLADRTDRVTAYDPVTYAVTFVPVTTSSDDCYIQAGQGLYFETLTNSWRARNCVSNNYGVRNTTYGLTAFGCRPCPQGMVTSTNATTFPNSASSFVMNPTGAGGFTSVRACVNPPGYGYNGRMSQPCDVGSYNQQDTYGICSLCGFGLTTHGVGKGVTRADCGIDKGYGYSAAVGAVVPCPIGTYNNAAFTADLSTPCTTCPTGTTTQNTATDDPALCNLCLGGWGGANCLSQCGGIGLNATYGDNGRPYGSDCTQCSWAATGFSFMWMMENDLFSAQAVAPTQADTSYDCLSEFAQMVDGAWYLPTTGESAMTVVENITAFADCVALCTSPDCQYVTYDYRAEKCNVRKAYDPFYTGAPLVAFKALASGDVGTNAWSIRNSSRSSGCISGCGSSNSSSSNSSNSSKRRILKQGAAAGLPVVDSGNARGTSVASGQYSFYQEPNALDVGVQSPAPGRDSFKLGNAGLQQCLNACDDSPGCAGITMLMLIDTPSSPRTCNLIRGVTTPGRGLRTVVRADVNRLTLPTFT